MRALNSSHISMLTDEKFISLFVFPNLHRTVFLLFPTPFTFHNSPLCSRLLRVADIVSRSGSGAGSLPSVVAVRWWQGCVWLSECHVWSLESDVMSLKDSHMKDRITGWHWLCMRIWRTCNNILVSKIFLPAHLGDLGGNNSSVSSSLQGQKKWLCKK